MIGGPDSLIANANRFFASAAASPRNRRHKPPPPTVRVLNRYDRYRRQLLSDAATAVKTNSFSGLIANSLISGN